MDVLEAIMQRRSTRCFSSRTVPDELLKELVKAGALAPSASNLQAWQFYLLTDPAPPPTPHIRPGRPDSAACGPWRNCFITTQTKRRLPNETG